ncbi:hypothetical protein MCHI_003912 [Candidatus Magnetoovum chiemensis]|nr:hypothetical protein MCHI_003912 [Candidatus Magnetoovum chiemensis]
MLKPFDMPIRTIAKAKPAHKKRATAVSPKTLLVCLNFSMPMPAITETAAALTIGDVFVNNPNATPTNDTCASVSAIKE